MGLRRAKGGTAGSGGAAGEGRRALAVRCRLALPTPTCEALAAPVPCRAYLGPFRSFRLTGRRAAQSLFMAVAAAVCRIPPAAFDAQVGPRPSPASV